MAGNPIIKFIIKLLYLLWMKTLRIRIVGDRGKPPFIYAFWHRNLFPLIYTHRKKGICVLVSLHSDGELVASLLKSYGFCVVRGSSTRGGVRAFVELLRKLEMGRIVAITPDGPKGPPLKLKPGVIEIARKARVPIYPVGVAFSRKKILNSWDKFKLPLPFSSCVVYISEPIQPEYVDERLLEEKLTDVERKAEAFIENASV